METYRYSFGIVPRRGYIMRKKQQCIEAIMMNLSSEWIEQRLKQTVSWRGSIRRLLFEANVMFAAMAVKCHFLHCIKKSKMPFSSLRFGHFCNFCPKVCFFTSGSKRFEILPFSSGSLIPSIFLVKSGIFIHKLKKTKLPFVAVVPYIKAMTMGIISRKIGIYRSDPYLG
ncbi:hypothetical protein Hanom_Chr05g00402421 [Helianthus anomalus]